MAWEKVGTLPPKILTRKIFYLPASTMLLYIKLKECDMKSSCRRTFQMEIAIDAVRVTVVVEKVDGSRRP